MEPTRIQKLKLWAKAHSEDIFTVSCIVVPSAAVVAVAIYYSKVSMDMELAERAVNRILPRDIRTETINGVERAVQVLADKDGAELWMFIVPSE